MTAYRGGVVTWDALTSIKACCYRAPGSKGPVADRLPA